MKTRLTRYPRVPLVRNLNTRELVGELGSTRRIRVLRFHISRYQSFVEAKHYFLLEDQRCGYTASGSYMSEAAGAVVGHATTHLREVLSTDKGQKLVGIVQRYDDDL